MSWRFKASKYKNAAPVEQKKELQLRNLSIGSFTGTVAALLERFFKELFNLITFSIFRSVNMLSRGGVHHGQREVHGRDVGHQRVQCWCTATGGHRATGPAECEEVEGSH